MISRTGKCLKCNEEIHWIGGWIDKPKCWRCGWCETPRELRNLDDDQIRMDESFEHQVTMLYIARIRARVTLADAAKILSVTPILLSGIEQGRYPPSRRLLRRLCRLYGATIRMPTS